MKNIITLLFICFFCVVANSQTTAIDSLAMRVTEGTSKDRIEFIIIPDSTENSDDWFRISSKDGNLVQIEGNNNISLAVGLNHYLKYIAGIHISWNNLTEKLPEILPVPDEPIFMETSLKNRYYLNYCTFSYSMPFWDEDRWMKEIDWMALHGINLVLSMTGIETVWKNLLEKYGYTYEEICEFIPGPSYMAWWQMNNLEGWGGPLHEEWFDTQEKLQKAIMDRMKELGIHPILPGYSGMVPRNFEQKTGIKIKDTGKWCGFPRPGFLSPEDSIFNVVADDYYRELENLYGLSEYYSMDPFHEGGDIRNIDLNKAGLGIYEAMKRANGDARWVIQSWQANPRQEMIDSIPPGELLILDLYSEKIPKWEKIGGYGDYQWLYCMLLNFGGNIGMHGRFDSLIDGFNRARNGEYSESLIGIGATPEGIENNPLMYELLFELPWRKEKIEKNEWLENYLTARYRQEPDSSVKEAWNILLNTVYNAPVDYPGEGTVESIICARPSWFPRSASTWGNSTLFYAPDSTAKAQKLMESIYEKYSPSSYNFIYDFIDITRQANADHANELINKMSKLYQEGKKDSVEKLSHDFLNLILKQDSILSTVTSMRSDDWIDSAGKLGGANKEAEELYRKNAAMLITVWGDSIAANKGGLHDYSHREWSGIIRELYYPRWKSFFDHELNGGDQPDYYRMEMDWIKSKIIPEVTQQ